MSKWEYIKAISKKSNRYGDKLLALMEKHKAHNLQQITEQQAKDFLEHLQDNNHQDEREATNERNSTSNLHSREHKQGD